MINFSNRRYERSHMKQPRGRGRWIFELPDGRRYDAFGTLTEAKAIVKGYLKEIGYSGTVYVMP